MNVASIVFDSWTDDDARVDDVNFDWYDNNIGLMIGISFLGDSLCSLMIDDPLHYLKYYYFFAGTWFDDNDDTNTIYCNLVVD